MAVFNGHRTATRDGRGKDGRREIMARKGKFEGGDQRGKEVRKGIGGRGRIWWRIDVPGKVKVKPECGEGEERE